MTPTCGTCGAALVCPRCTGAKGGKAGGPAKARPRKLAQKAARASAEARKAKDKTMVYGKPGIGRTEYAGPFQGPEYDAMHEQFKKAEQGIILDAINAAFPPMAVPKKTLRKLIGKEAKPSN